MYSIATNIYVKAGAEEDFISVSKIMLKQAHQESYLHWVDLLQKTDDTTEFILYEAFRSEEDSKRHLLQTYMQEWISACSSLFSDKVFKVPSHVQVK